MNLKGKDIVMTRAISGTTDTTSAQNHPAYQALTRFVDHATKQQAPSRKELRTCFAQIVDGFNFWGFELFGPRSKDGDIHEALVQIMNCVCKKHKMPGSSAYNANHIVNTRVPTGANFVAHEDMRFSDQYFTQGIFVRTYDRTPQLFDRLPLAQKMTYIRKAMAKRIADNPALAHYRK